jgi:hypothetical protein
MRGGRRLGPQVGAVGAQTQLQACTHRVRNALGQRRGLGHTRGADDGGRREATALSPRRGRVSCVQIRKEAVRAVSYTLQAVAGTPAAASAGEAVVAAAAQALAAPAAAAAQALGRRGKDGAVAEAEVARTAAAALHCLFALRRLAPRLPAPAAAALVAPLLEVRERMCDA